MKDIKGQPIAVGDTVVFSVGNCMDIGTVTKIYANQKECTVNSISHIRDFRICKYPFETYQQILNQMMKNESETALGEPQYWIYLTDGRSIEITLESDGLAVEDQYYSIRLHCSETEFDKNTYHGTCGVIDQYATEDSTFSDILPIVYDVLQSHKGMIDMKGD